jgi:hypothetical protein
MPETRASLKEFFAVAPPLLSGMLTNSILE